MVHCIRGVLTIDSAEKARESLLDIDTWPAWNSNAIKVLTSDSGKMVAGQKLAFHSMSKGALLETRWNVDSIRYHPERHHFGLAHHRHARGMRHLL